MGLLLCSSASKARLHHGTPRPGGPERVDGVDDEPAGGVAAAVERRWQRDHGLRRALEGAVPGGHGVDRRSPTRRRAWRGTRRSRG